MTPERYLNTLRTIADDKMSGPLLRSACYVAHLTWMTSQPFRGADRIARLSQFTFSNLPPNEQVKDREHVVKAARFIVDKLGAELAAAA